MRAAGRAIDRGDPAEARLVAEVLFARQLGVTQAGLYARFRDPLADSDATTLEGLLNRYRADEPLAYLIGRREFYGLDLKVSPAVLIPRPETEQIVERALDWIEAAQAAGRRVRVADIGTGSGALTLAIAHHAPDARIWATDCSGAALEVARQNAAELGLAERVTFLQGDLVDPLPEPVELLVANLPYVPRRDGALLADTAGWEPDLALDGGADGLRVVERLLATAGPKLAVPWLVLLEIGAGQGAAVAELAERHLGPVATEIHQDANGHERIVALRSRPPIP